MEIIVFKDLKKITKKLEQTTCRKEFLEDCKNFRVIPKFMRIKNKTLINFYRNEVRQFEWKLLKKIIRKQYAEITEATRKRNELLDKLMNVTNKEKLDVFINKLNFYREKEIFSCTNRQNKKLSFCLRERGYLSNKSKNQNKKHILYNNKLNTELKHPAKMYTQLRTQIYFRRKNRLK